MTTATVLLLPVYLPGVKKMEQLILYLMLEASEAPREGDTSAILNAKCEYNIMNESLLKSMNGFTENPASKIANINQSLGVCRFPYAVRSRLDRFCTVLRYRNSLSLTLTLQDQHFCIFMGN